MPWVTHVVVVLGVTGGIEGVVASDSVLDNLYQGTHVDIEVLGVQPGERVGRSHEASGHGGVETTFHPLVQVGNRKALEVRALPALDIDDLNEFPCGDLVGAGRGLGNPEVLVLVSQGVREYLDPVGESRATGHPSDHVGRRVLLVGQHLGSRHTNHTHQIGLRGKA